MGRRISKQDSSSSAFGCCTVRPGIVARRLAAARPGALAKASCRSPWACQPWLGPGLVHFPPWAWDLPPPWACPPRTCPCYGLAALGLGLPAPGLARATAPMARIQCKN